MLRWPRDWDTSQQVWPLDDVARYREQIAKRKAREEAGERDGWEPGGYKWHKWDQLREEKRRAEVRSGVNHAIRVDPGY